ncbi:MAG TPA: class I SAM-dependent methyltransferase [Solirubrobacterales bacterium]
MKQQTRSRIASGLDRARLLGAVERLRAGWLTMQARGGPDADPDGLPLPPSRLRLLVDGRSGDAERFLWVGAQAAGSLRAAAADSGTPIENMAAILDFGCGSGRVARHWANLEGVEVHGCDYNEDLVAWCEDNLPFVRAIRNELAPPTSYETESFDLIYALSVLSHLSEPLQHAWVAEFRRLLKPGGLLIVSMLGNACRDRLTDEERRRYDRGELVVERPRMVGSNLCTAYHPRAYVTDHLLDDFTDIQVLEFGSSEQSLMQDTYIARLPGGA